MQLVAFGTPLRAAIVAGVAALLAAAAPPVSASPDRSPSTRTFRGTLEVRHGDDFRSGKARHVYTLVQERGRRMVVLRRGPRPHRSASVVLRGREVGTRIVGEVIGSERSASPRSHVPAAGPRKVLVLLFNFATDPREPWTVEQVRQRIFTDPNSTAAFYEEQSYGQTELIGKLRPDGDIYGWYTIAAEPSGCDVFDWTIQARQAARDAGVDLSDYNHTIYAFPWQSSCSWSGLGDVGDIAGGWSWLNGTLSVSVVAHELGHNLGLHHASSYSCSGAGGEPVAISSNCSVNEYGDPFDVMGGYGSRHSHGWHLQKLGYLQESNLLTVTDSGTYTIRSALTQSSDPTLLRIPRVVGGSALDYYYLDFRTAGGVFDDFLSSDPVVQGVSVRINPEPTVVTQSWLIDMTPGSSGFFRDAALGTGRSFSDGTVTIRATEITGETATVEVTVPESESPQPPPDPPEEAQPPPEPPENAESKVVITGPKKIRVRGGKAVVRISSDNSVDADCSLSLKGRLGGEARSSKSAKLGSASFTLPAHGSLKVKVKLSGNARRALAERRRLRVEAKARLVGPAGAERMISRKMNLISG